MADESTQSDPSGTSTTNSSLDTVDREDGYDERPPIARGTSHLPYGDDGKLMQVFEAFTDSLVITDEQYRIVHANPAFERISGYSKAQALGKSLWRFQGSSTRGRSLDGSQDSSRGGWCGRVTCRRADGTTYVVERSITPLADESGSDGRRLEYLIVDHDISHELDLEQHLRRTHKLEALGSLARGIAHSLNNILMPIIINSELIEVSCDSNNRVRQYIERVLKAARRGSELVSQILEFTRRSPLAVAVVSLHEVIDEALDIIEVAIPDSIEVVRSYQAEPDLVEGNATQIQEALINLFANAIQAMEGKDGRLAVSLETVDLTGDESGTLRPSPGTLQPSPGTSYVHIEVSDTGRGIEPEHLDKIFAPLFTTKSREEGSGLGLPVVLDIVERHQAFISVDSSPQQGTTFHLYFPCTYQSRPEVQDEDPTPQQHKGWKVVVLDDEPDVVEALLSLLAAEGCSAKGFSQSREAMEYLYEHGASVDLLMTDLHLPGLDGLELIERFRAVHPNTPVLLFSGDFTELERDRFRVRPENFILEKPLDRAAVQHVLSALKTSDRAW